MTSLSVVIPLQVRSKHLLRGSTVGWGLNTVTAVPQVPREVGVSYEH